LVLASLTLLLWVLSVPTIGGRRVVFQWYGPLGLATVWEGKLIWMDWSPSNRPTTNWFGSWIGVTEDPDLGSFGLSLPGQSQSSGRNVQLFGTAVPLWLPLVITLALTAVASILIRRRPPPGHCAKCHYNLTGNTSGICPECGTLVLSVNPPGTDRPARFSKTALAILLFVLAAPKSEASAPARAPDIAIARLEHKYAVTIEVAAQRFSVPWGEKAITGRRPSREALNAWLPIFESEWNLYPLSLVSNSGLERIVFCSNLAFDHHRVGGLADIRKNTIYYDIDSRQGHEYSTRRGIHHEFFHMIDFKDQTMYGDLKWRVLNPRGFSYSNPTEPTHNMFSTWWSIRADGFLTDYSMTNSVEDKAEVFSLLMVSTYAVDKRAETDKVIRAKRDLMKQRLGAFCEEADENFWKNAGRLNRGYQRPTRFWLFKMFPDEEIMLQD
ncbi:MAG TPA: putative zinc-binding metallopeptidase, partial [Phycisphaerae bacterium]|nr:putative zinc-binding metallopeptidase [Phycisphaerae bacterium]